jgi:hypothetical protein
MPGGNITSVAPTAHAMVNQAMCHVDIQFAALTRT